MRVIERGVMLRPRFATCDCRYSRQPSHALRPACKWLACLQLPLGAAHHKCSFILPNGKPGIMQASCISCQQIFIQVQDFSTRPHCTHTSLNHVGYVGKVRLRDLQSCADLKLACGATHTEALKTTHCVLACSTDFYQDSVNILHFNMQNRLCS